jgi:hypothetical protein
VVLAPQTLVCSAVSAPGAISGSRGTAFAGRVRLAGEVRPMLMPAWDVVKGKQNRQRHASLTEMMIGEVVAPAVASIDWR